MNNLSFNLPYSNFSQSTNIHSIQGQNNTFQSISNSYPTYSILPPTLHSPNTLEQQEQLPTSSSSSTSDITTKNRLDNTSNDTTSTPNRIRITRPPNAFLLFNKEMRKRLKIDNPNWSVGEISKEISERWKSLSQDEKGQYVLQANKIKESQQALHPNAMYIRRSKAELTEAGHYEKIEKKRTFNVDLSSSSPSHSLELSSSPNHHHPSLNTSLSSSSSSFTTTGTTTYRKKSKKKKDRNPGAPKHPLSAYMWFLTGVRPKTRQLHPKLTVGEISKLCADQWKTMTEDEKLPWVEKATNDKTRYAREMFFYANQNTHPLGRGTRQKYRSFNNPFLTNPHSVTPTAANIPEHHHHSSNEINSIGINNNNNNNNIHDHHDKDNSKINEMDENNNNNHSNEEEIEKIRENQHHQLEKGKSTNENDINNSDHHHQNQQVSIIHNEHNNMNQNDNGNINMMNDNQSTPNNNYHHPDKNSLEN